MRIMKRIVFAFLLLFGYAGAQQVDSPERVARIENLLQQYVDKKQVAGAVALVLRDGHPAYLHAFGWSDKEAGRTMTTETLFRIASQSKAITSTAVLSLYEEGKIALDDPVCRF